MALTPEGRVKKAVKEYLTSIGAYYYMPVSNGMGRVGAPDFLVCYLGRFIGIETKAPGKRAYTTANQDREHNEIRAAQGLCVVVESVDEVKELFKISEDHSD